MAQTLPPAGPAVALVALSIAMLVLTWVIVMLRFGVRIAIHALGLDDYLMAIGLALFSTLCGLTIGMCYNGGGHLTADIPTDIFQNGMKYFFLAQLTNVVLSVPVKCSICCTLLRIAESKLRFCYTLYGIMAVTVVTAISCFIAVLLVCRPLPAFWAAVEGTCNANASSAIGYYLSAVSIATDWTLAALPILMLRKIQLKRRIKISVAIILALAALASVGPIVRLQYLIRYGDPETILFNGAKITIWTIVEFGIGITAGSIPQLRPLLRYIPHLSSSYNRSTSDHPSRTLGSRPRHIKMDAIHQERDVMKGSDSTRRIHGRDELDLNDTDNDSRDGPLSDDVESNRAAVNSWPLPEDRKLSAGVIHRETEVTVQPYSVDDEIRDRAATSQFRAQSPNFTFYEGGVCKTEVWHRPSPD